MRISNPPNFIMKVSLIMKLIMTLIVFQCGGALDAHAAKVASNLVGETHSNGIEVTQLSDQCDIEPVSTTSVNEPEPDVISVDADAPLATSFEMRLRNLATNGMSMISANYCTIIFVVLLAIMWWPCSSSPSSAA